MGTPGTPATWDQALRRFGTLSFKKALQPATRLAARGFVVDSTFRQQTLDNAARFRAFDSTRDLFLPGGDAPQVGSVFRNPDLAATYKLLAKKGIAGFYSGPLADEIVQTVQEPPKRPDTDLPVPPGFMEKSDLAAYRAIGREPTHVGYRGLDVYGMPPSSSGGTTVGEALNILEQFDLAGMSDADALHRYLEASALSFADRNAYVGDPAFVDVPVSDLLSDTFAKERACEIDPDHALNNADHPQVAPGDVDQLRRRVRRRHADAAGTRSPTPRTCRPRTSPPATSGATSRSTRSPSSRPAAPASWCPAAASCSTTS